MANKNFFAESPSRTRIRQLHPDSHQEFIADVSVKVVNGSVGMRELDLSRLATELLVEHLKKEL